MKKNRVIMPEADMASQGICASASCTNSLVPPHRPPRKMPIQRRTDMVRRSERNAWMEVWPVINNGLAENLNVKAAELAETIVDNLKKRGYEVN